MNDISQSYLKVQYDLRPAKQVERRMFIESFQLLAEAGYSVRDYQYTGMGSIHFIDFALFHKFIGINKLTSIEIASDINDRLKFNTPFSGCVDVHSGIPIGDHIPELDKDIGHVLWLDYDNVLSIEMLRDTTQAVSELPDGSILLITVDTEPPKSTKPQNKNTKMDESETHAFYEEIADGFASYYIDTWTTQDFTWENLAKVNLDLFRTAIEEGLKGRNNGEFIPLFHFLYSDGHRMLTIGGMIGTSKDKRVINKSRIATMDYIRLSFDEEPFWIIVPKITRKERLYLDSNMPADSDWKPKDFEIPANDLENYRRIYRFFPSYAELFL